MLIILIIFAVVQKTSDNRKSIGGIKIFTVITGSMIPVYDENSGVIVTEENGEHSVIFNDKDQSVKYNIVLKNNTNKDIPIDNLMLPKPTEDFLKYELTGLNSGDVIKANSTKDVVISLETVKTEGWGRNFDIVLTSEVSLDSSVLNPNTNDFVVILFILSIIFGCSVFVLKNKKVARYGILIIGFFSIVPYINADKVYMVPIKINVSFESQNVMSKSGKDGFKCGVLDACYIEDDWFYFWKHSDVIKNIYIENAKREIKDYAYEYDVSEEQNGRVKAYLVENANDSDYYDLYLIADGMIYPNSDASYYFAFFDRLETIKRQDPEQHLVVLSNIVLAKTLLKKGECYKPHHASENAQGGLGGVGTENWILQNGGSLEDAATEFLIAAGIMRIEEKEDGTKEVVIDENTQKQYDDFKTTYSIWDFGQNQLSEKRSREFPYDNFIWNNMNQKGYMKMAKTMQTYLLELHPEFRFEPRKDTSSLTEEEQVQLDSVATNVKTFLQGLKPTNSYGNSSEIEETKGK